MVNPNPNIPNNNPNDPNMDPNNLNKNNNPFKPVQPRPPITPNDPRYKDTFQGYDPNQYRQIPSSNLGDEDDDFRGKKRKSDIDWKAALTGAVIAILIIFVVYSFLMPVVGKKVYEADITRLENDLVAVRAVNVAIDKRVATLEDSNNTLVTTINNKLAVAIDSINTKTNSLENLINQKISGFVTSSEVDNRIHDSLVSIKEDISSFSSDIASFSSQLNGLDTKINNTVLDKIASYSSDIDAIKVRLSAIETSITNLSDTTVPNNNEDVLKITVKQQSPYLSVYTTTTEDCSLGYLRLTITNTTNKDIENIIVGLGINLPAFVMPNKSSISGGTLGWSVYPYSNLYWVTSGWGYTIKAGDKLVLDVVVKLWNDNAGVISNIGNPQYLAETYVESWDYK